MQRRSFLKLLTSLLGATALGAFLYPLFRFLLPVEIAARFKSLEVPESEVPLGGFKDLMIGVTPAIIVHTKEKGLRRLIQGLHPSRLPGEILSRKAALHLPLPWRHFRPGGQRHIRAAAQTATEVFSQEW